MDAEILARLDFARREDPAPGNDLRLLLTDWLEYQRHEFQRKLRDLSDEALVAWSVPPLELSVLGLVRHMQQNEHIYFTWGLGGGERVVSYGDDDFAGGSVETVIDDLRRYLDEVEQADQAIAAMPDLQYALHAGQAHMLRFAALGELIR